MFRACVLAVYNLSGASRVKMIMLAPLSFGAGTSPASSSIAISRIAHLLPAHLHHAWDTFNRYGRTPAAAKRALLMACTRPSFYLAKHNALTPHPVFQLSYTTLFGSFASYLFLRTGSIWPPITAHIFCNIMGIPQLGYEVSKFPQQKRCKIIRRIFVFDTDITCSHISGLRDGGSWIRVEARTMDKDTR